MNFTPITSGSPTPPSSTVTSPAPTPRSHLTRVLATLGDSPDEALATPRSSAASPAKTPREIRDLSPKQVQLPKDPIARVLMIQKILNSHVEGPLGAIIE